MREVYDPYGKAFAFCEGVIIGEQEYKIRIGYRYEFHDLGNFSLCKHAILAGSKFYKVPRSLAADNQEEEEITECSYILPYSLVAYNESGFAMMAICLDCLLAAAAKLDIITYERKD